MKGDFSKYSFIKDRHYSNVLMQQGRVQLDSDWNEFQAIYDHQVQATCRDTIGKCGVPADGGGFGIGVTLDGKDLTISAGRGYVDGILCEIDLGTPVQATISGQTNVAGPTPLLGRVIPPQINQIIVDKLKVDGRDFKQGQYIELSATGVPSSVIPPVTFQISSVTQSSNTLTLSATILPPLVSAHSLEVRRVPSYLLQEDYFPDPTITPDQGSYYFVYLDAWKRHITALEDPHIKEVALGGADTTTRIKTLCQVKLQKWNPQTQTVTAPNCSDFPLIPFSTGMMNARTAPPSKPTNLCQIPLGSNAGYRGLENQLYRVEIHDGGQLGGTVSGANPAPTFKWARDNASSVTAIESVTGQDIIVSDLGKGCFKNGQWVEISTDVTELAGAPGQLVQIQTIDNASRKITVKPAPSSAVQYDMDLHPKLRCWDTGESGAMVIAASTGWVELNTSDGVQVQFSPGSYNTGDYWLVPARTRTATGELEWPPFEVPNNNPQPQPPIGIRHHYCVLAIVQYTQSGWQLIKDCRNVFPPLCRPALHVAKISWRNDGNLSIQGFLQNGLQIDLDGPPDAISVVNDNTMIVAIEESVIQRPTNQIMILPGTATVSGNSIYWNMLQLLQRLNVTDTPSVMDQVNAAASTGGVPITLRILLKGRFIWGTQRDKRVYLDGQALGKPGTNFDGSNRIDLDLPSGDCQKASDFESWVRLVANTPPLQITAVDFFDAGGKSIGHFPSPGSPAAGTQYTLPSVMNAISITFSRPIKPESLGTIGNQSVTLSRISRFIQPQPSPLSPPLASPASAPPISVLVTPVTPVFVTPTPVSPTPVTPTPVTPTPATPTPVTPTPIVLPTFVTLIPGSVDLSPDGTVVRFSITDSTQIHIGDNFRLEVLAKSVAGGAPAIVAAEDNTPLDGNNSGSPGGNNFDMNFRIVAP